MVWRKKEIYVTTSMSVFAKVRDLLAGKGIRYESRTENSNFMRIEPGRRVEIPRNTCQHIYKVYVHRKDVEQANEVLRQLTEPTNKVK